MSPSKSCCIDEIGALWTDEQLFAFLESIQGGSLGASLPCNVIADINPYVYEPSNLPEDIWFVVHPEDRKQAKVGFWKAKGDPCQIYSDNSSAIGWRTTLEFYQGCRPSNGHRTHWVMQEYSISDNGSSKDEGGSSLCRVFISDREGETKANDGVNKCSRPLEKSKPQEEMEIHQAMLHAECFAEGDYLELLDLDPHSSSSSSESSSCVTPSSDLYFDSAALLQELEDKVCQTKPSSYKFSVSRPNDTVIVVAGQGSLTRGSDKGVEPVKVEALNDAAGASSSRQMSGDDKGKKVYRGKLIKKFFCFMAF